MANHAPSAIFSPSIARAQAASQKDWSYITSWLQSHYPSQPLPAFERNAQTLSALLSLAALNESANDDRDLLFAAQKRALNDYKRQEEERSEDDARIKILDQLENGLERDGKVALDSLAETCIDLCIPYPETIQVLEKVMDLQTSLFDLEQASDRISTLHSHLQRELSSIQNLVADLRDNPVYAPPASLAKSILNTQRQSKVLQSKLPELNDRVVALERMTAGPGGVRAPTIQEIKDLENRYNEVLAVVKKLERRVRSYHGLPHDVDGAREQLEILREELTLLTRKRDGLFESLVEKASPMKRR